MDSFLLHSLKTALVFSVFYGFYWFLLRRDTHFRLNRFYLIAAMGVSVFLPLVRMENPFRVIFVESTPKPTPLSIPYLPASAEGIDWVLGLYLAGMVFFLFRMLRQLFHVLNLAAKGERRTCEGVALVATDFTGAPFSFFHTVFIGRKNLRPHDLERILAHEKVHAGQWHTLDCILAELFTAFQWYNPLVWPYKRSLKETHEYLADHAVISQGCEVAGYQMLILEQVVGRKLFEMTNHFRRSQVGKRITMMKRSQSGRLSMAKILFCIPLVMAVILIFAGPKYVVKPVQTGSSSIVSDWADQAFITDEYEIPKFKIQEKKDSEMKLQEQKVAEAMGEDSKKDLQTMQTSAADDLRRKISAMKDEVYKLTHQKDTPDKFSGKIERMRKNIADANTDEEKKKWTETLHSIEREQQDEKNHTMDMIKKYKNTIYLYEQKLKEIEQAEKSGQAKKS